MNTFYQLIKGFWFILVLFLINLLSGMVLAAEVSILSVQWVRPGEYPLKSAIWNGQTIRLSLARHEDEPIMILLKNGGEVLLSDLIGADDTMISSVSHKYFLVHQVITDNIDCFDAQTEVKGPIKAPAESCVLVRIYSSRDTDPGIYKGNLKAGSENFDVEVRVFPFTLPRKATLMRFTPFWSSGSFAKGEKQKAIIYMNTLWRGRVTPAHGFAGKRTWWGNEGKPPTAIDFSRTDWFFKHAFDVCGVAAIDIDLFYHSTLQSRNYRKIKPIPSEFPRITAYLKTCREYYKKKGWFDSMFVQNIGDEPKMTGTTKNRQHCSYEHVILWSKPIKEAGWRCLIAEHPAPQLFDSIDIFNAAWTHISPGDGAELRAMNPPKNIISYNYGGKRPMGLFIERAMVWKAFMMDLDGIWSWHAYNNGMGKKYNNYRQSLFYGSKHFNTDKPVLTLRCEAWGEGADDWEYLRLIEKKFGRAMALSFASTTTNFTGQYPQNHTWRTPEVTDFTPQTLFELRDLMARLYMSEKAVESYDDFKTTARIEFFEGLVHDEK